MKITIFGGSGFVGRVLVQKLLAAGHAVRVISRKTALRPDGYEITNADPYDPVQRRACIRDQDAVINLIGILQGDEAAFYRAHATLAEELAQACLDESVPLFLHMSALHADPQGMPRWRKSWRRHVWMSLYRFSCT